ncbi:MAG TPA: DUF4347 domain-containing protein, partial [Tepidisphaeraceae bacterium]|nr:DUF4347 domain-containing protein [Tepidisphaeraceae bacterium]
MQKNRDILARQSAPRTLRAPGLRRARPSFLLEPLEQRRVMSAGLDIALIDSTLAHEDLLASAMNPGGHVIVYDGQHDSAADVLKKVTDWANANDAKIGSLSLLSHASAGRFALGNDWISKGNLKETATAWRNLSDVLADDANINLYGCNLADRLGDGQALINKLSKITGASVFASANLTGRGGDWILEASSRRADAADWKSAFNISQLIQWDGDLAIAQGTEFRVNTYTADTQHNAAIATSASGMYVVAFASFQTISNSYGVYFRRYDSSGTALDAADVLVNTTIAHNQDLPSIAMDAAGNFVIVWMSDQQDGSGKGIYGQRFDAAGARVGGEFQVNTTTANNQDQPTVAMDDAGDFIVAWKTDKVSGSGTDVYAQLYNSSGAAVGGEFRANVNTVDNQDQPAAAMDASGNFVIVWKSNKQDGSGGGVFGRRYDSAGNAVGGEFQANTTNSGNQDKPTVAMNESGAFVVAWASGNNQDGDKKGVFAQRYSSSGARIGGEFLVNVFTTGDQDRPSVSMNRAGGFVITWASNNQDGGGKGIYLRNFDASGNPINIYLVNTTTANNQDNPAVAMQPGGNLMVAWEGNGPGDTTGVFGQRYVEPGIVVSAISNNTAESGWSGQFSIVLLTQPTANVTINLSSSNASEGILSANFVTFTTGNWNTAQFVTVTGVDDFVDDGDVAFSIITSPANSTDSDYSGWDPADVAVTNVDDDTAGFTINPINGLITSEAGGSAGFTIVLNSQPTADVTLNLSSSNTSEGTVSVGSVTFTAANWNIAQTVNVSGVDDFVDDGNIAFTIITAAAVSADANYSGIDPTDISDTNNDDDT